MAHVYEFGVLRLVASSLEHFLISERRETERNIAR